MNDTTLLILIVIFFAVLAFIYRFFSNPYFFARVIRFFLRFRYKVILDGFDEMMRAERVLLMPNHPAYLDPILLFEEIYARNRKVSPMTDEKFFRNPAYRQILSLGDAVMVPDLMKNRSEAAVRQAAHLVQIAVKALEDGRSLVFYPSGHVTLDGKETIGNRRMAYETVSAINSSPADSPLRQVRLFLLRTRGMETSRWSKSRRKLLNSPLNSPPKVGGEEATRFVASSSSAAGAGSVRTQNRPAGGGGMSTISSSLPWSFDNPGPFRRRRVVMHFEDMTDTLLEWSRKYDKAEFNRQLEGWYNQGNNL